MILNYLKKYHELILNNKVILESERQTLKDEIKKNEKYIEKLKKESGAALDGFSPRALEINYDEEIKKYRSIIVKLEEQSTSLKECIKEIDNEIFHLLENIENVKKYEIDKNKNIEICENKIIKTDKEETKQSLKKIIHKVELCISFIKIDPDRSKLELKTIKKYLEDLINDIEQ